MLNIPLYTQVRTIDSIARLLAKTAIRALYLEVKAYPKPGLVSFYDSGAHADMDGELFYRSLVSLRHYFFHTAKQSLMNIPFNQLRELGIEAEQHMVLTTKGINTHRGAIFALGIMCISTSKIIYNKNRFSPEELHSQLLQDWQLALQSHALPNDSNGALVRNRYTTIIDAKSMASGGYKVIFDLLPDFIEIYKQTNCLNSSCLYAYILLILQVDDTNLLFRKGQDGLDFARKKAKELLLIPCLNSRLKQAEELHQLFSLEKISPGGVADLIGVILFISQLFCPSIY